MKKILFLIILFSCISYGQLKPYSWYWDGADQVTAENVGVGSALTGKWELTIECWVYLEDLVNNYQPIYDSGATGNNGLILSFVAKTQNLCLYLNGPCANWSQICTTPIPLRKWTHVVAEYNKGHVYFWVNGKFNNESSVSINNVVTSLTTDAVSLIGRFYGSSAGVAFLKGSIRELRIWNYARSSQQIASAWNRVLLRKYPGLLANYHLNKPDFRDIDNTIGNKTVTNSAVTQTTSNPPVRYED